MGNAISRNFALQAAGKAVSVVLGLVMIAILTRALGPEGYGAFTTASTYLQFFGVIVDFGLTLTLLVMISESGADEAKVAGNVLGLRLFSAAILFALAPVIALPIPWSAQVKAAVLVGSLAYFFMAGSTMLVGIYQKHAVIARAAAAEVASRVVLVALTALLAWAGAGLTAMFAALVVANALWLALSVWFARPFVRLRPLADLAVWRSTLARSWPIALSIIFNLVYLKGDVLILSLVRSQEEVGFYGVAYRFLDVFTALPAMFMGLMLPSLVSDWTAGKKDEFRRHVNRAFDLFALFIAPMTAGGIAIAPSLIALVAGSGFDAAAPALAVLMLATPGIFLGALYGHAVVGIGKQRAMVLGYAATAAVTTACYLYAIPRWGILGAAWGTVISETFMLALTYWMVSRVSGARPGLAVAGKALVASAAMFALLKWLPPMPALPAVAIGAACYGALAFALRAFTLDDLRALVPHRAPDLR